MVTASMSATESADAVGGIPWRSPALYVILSSSLIGVMGVSLLSPVLPELRPVFGVGDSEVGLLITVYTLPGVFLTPFLGLAADRFGRRAVLVPLLFVFGVAGAAISFVSSYDVVLALRFLQGVGGSGLITLAVTLIGDVYHDAQRDSVMGLNAGSISVGAAFYPLIGGLLAAIRWNVPFLFFAVSIAVGLLAYFLLDEPGGRESMGVRRYVGSLGSAFLAPTALLVFAAIFLVFLVFYGLVLTALPLLLSDAYSLGSGSIGLVLSMVSVAAAVIASQYDRVARWQSKPNLIALGFTLYGASLLGVYLADTPVQVGAALLLFGVAFGIVMPSIDTVLITHVSTKLRAGVMGLRTSVLRAGQTVGPFLFTVTAENYYPTAVQGYRSFLPVTAAVLLVVGLTAIASLWLRTNME